MRHAEMRIGYLADFAPFTFRGPRGAQGTLVALLRGRSRVRFVAAGLETLPDMLHKGDIDAILPKAMTAERSAAFDFSQPLAMTGAALFATGPIAPAIAAAGVARIATPGTGPLAALLPALAPGCRVVSVADYAAAFAAVADGQADLAALNADAGAVMAGGRFTPGPRFAELPLCLAARPGDGPRVFGRLGLT
jgi:ABC-type amino acid transport substrate-binding protein